MKLALATSVAMFLTCQGATPIKKLLDDPGHYDGKTVSIAGEVKSSIGVLGYGAYEVDDGTGRIPVVVQSGGSAPRVGAEVGVEGEFRNAFTLGSRTVAVIMEKRHKTR